jgi:uncharacterized OsmC-like protein
MVRYENENSLFGNSKVGEVQHMMQHCRQYDELAIIMTEAVPLQPTEYTQLSLVGCHGLHCYLVVRDNVLVDAFVFVSFLAN